MRVAYIIFIIFIVYSSIFGFKIITKGEILKGDIYAVDQEKIYIKFTNQSTISILRKDFVGISSESSHPFGRGINLKNGYTLNGKLIDVKKDYLIFSLNNGGLLKVKKNNLESYFVKKNFLYSKILYTKFGYFFFEPLEIIYEKHWKVKTDYGIVEISSKDVLPFESVSKAKYKITTFRGVFFQDLLKVKDNCLIIPFGRDSLKIRLKDVIQIIRDNFSPKIKSNPFKTFDVVIKENKVFYVNNIRIHNDYITIDNQSFNLKDLLYLSNRTYNLIPIDDKLLYILSADESGIYAFKKLKREYIKVDFTGKIIWSLKVDKYYPYDPLVIYKDYVIIFSKEKNKIFFVNRFNGKVEKSYDVLSPFSAPAILNENELIVVGWKGNVYLVNTKDNKVKEIFKAASNVLFPPVTDGKRIVISDIKGNIYVIDKNGNLIKKLFIKERVTSGFSLFMNKIFFGTRKGDFYILNLNSLDLKKYKVSESSLFLYPTPLKDGSVLIGAKNHLMKFKDGKILWKVELSDTLNGSAIVINDTVFVVDLNGFLYTINSKNGNMKKIGFIYFNRHPAALKNGIIIFSFGKYLLLYKSLIEQPTYIFQYLFNEKRQGFSSLKF